MQPYNLLPRVGSSMAEEWLDIGLQHHIANKLPEAEQAYMKGLRIDPNHGPLIANMAVASAQQGKLLEAIQRFERSLLFAPENPTTWYNYALALLEAEKADEALPAINKSVEIMESAAALCAKGMILTSVADAKGAAEAYDRALDKEPTHPMASYNSIFVRTLKETTPEENYIVRKRWYDNHRWTGEKKPHDNDKTPDRVLRVGYLGGDFKMHSAAFIFGMIVLNHDRAVVEPFCYMSMPPDPEKDVSTKNFMTRTNWRDVSAVDDDHLEAGIRADKIDILVDLAAHTGGNRLPMFTRKPAPVQVHAWGFAHGSGVPEIDYMFADPDSLPEEERKWFPEKIWDLSAIVCFGAPEYNQPGVSHPPVGRDGIFNFGVFGRYEKHSPESLEAWHQILQRVPKSRVLFKDLMMRRPYVIRRLREVFHDIEPERLLFLQDTSHPEQMLAYQRADLILDTFPHTGGVTALEMLNMGVPVLTVHNTQVGGRTTSMALKAIGRPRWVASSISEYVEKAVALATTGRDELATARQTLHEEMQKSPMCSPTYVREVETAYRQMWWRYCGYQEQEKTVMVAAE